MLDHNLVILFHQPFWLQMRTELVFGCHAGFQPYRYHQDRKRRLRRCSTAMVISRGMITSPRDVLTECQNIHHSTCFGVSGACPAFYASLPSPLFMVPVPYVDFSTAFAFALFRLVCIPAQPPSSLRNFDGFRVPNIGSTSKPGSQCAICSARRDHQPLCRHSPTINFISAKNGVWDDADACSMPARPAELAIQPCLPPMMV